MSSYTSYDWRIARQLAVSKDNASAAVPLDTPKATPEALPESRCTIPLATPEATIEALPESNGTNSDKVKELFMNIHSHPRQMDTVALGRFVQTLRSLSSVASNPPLQDIIDNGAIPYMIEFLTHSNKSVALDASWLLTNIASGTTEQTKTVVTAIPIFVSLLSREDDRISEQAAWAIGNIAGDSPQYRDMVLNTKGSLEGILYLIKNSKKKSVVGNCVWVYSNLCRGKPRPDFDNVKSGIPIMMYVLQTYADDTGIVADACWAMSYLTDDEGNSRIQAVLDFNVVPIMGPLLGHAFPSIVIPALRTMGNIITGTDQQTQAVLNVGFLDHMKPLLDNPKDSIKREVYWAISNITAGNETQVAHVIDKKFLKMTMERFHPQRKDVQKEMLWVLSNATSCSSVSKSVFQEGVLPFLFKMQALENDAVLGKIILEGIENMIKALSVDERSLFLDDFKHLDATVFSDLRYQDCFINIKTLFQEIVLNEKLKSTPPTTTITCSFEKISTPPSGSLEKISSIPPKCYNSLSFGLGSLNVDSLEKSHLEKAHRKLTNFNSNDIEMEGKNTKSNNKCSCLKLSFLFLFIFLFLLTIFLIVFVRETGSLPSLSSLPYPFADTFSKLFHF
eukprot:Awhi_evm1s13279